MKLIAGTRIEPSGDWRAHRIILDERGKHEFRLRLALMLLADEGIFMVTKLDRGAIDEAREHGETLRGWYNSADSLAAILETWNPEPLITSLTGVYCGDCTKQCHSCDKCMAEEIVGVTTADIKLAKMRLGAETDCG